MMKKLEYIVTFVTPAFLGNAEQSAQWRTPPFKALLRQWWRVAYAAERRFMVKLDEMRREEGLLFGHAWLDDDKDEKGNKVAARKSAVRMRLNRWDEGKLKSWQSLGNMGKVSHPEVKAPVGSDLYLGYGPLNYSGGGTALKANAAIQAGESAKLSLAVPEASSTLIEQALWLMDRFGAAGGRSRNGWGSLSLAPAEGTLPISCPLRSRPWEQALTLDWPHAIGQDTSGLLIWQTQPFEDWKALMKELATIKIGLRTKFRFTTGKNAERPEARHWLSYPVTNHSVKPWGNNARLPNSLRFKVRQDKQEPKKLCGVIFHMPCLPPKEFRPDPQSISSVWQQVHDYLDRESTPVTRIAD